MANVVPPSRERRSDRLKVAVFWTPHGRSVQTSHLRPKTPEVLNQTNLPRGVDGLRTTPPEFRGNRGRPSENCRFH